MNLCLAAADLRSSDLRPLVCGGGVKGQLSDFFFFHTTFQTLNRSYLCVRRRAAVTEPAQPVLLTRVAENSPEKNDESPLPDERASDRPGERQTISRFLFLWSRRSIRGSVLRSGSTWILRTGQVTQTSCLCPRRRV